jgi:hypothetical protein
MLAKKILAIALCALISGCSAFDKSEKSAQKSVAMPPPAVTQAWLDVYEPKVREAIKGTHFEFERRENCLRCWVHSAVWLSCWKLMNPSVC